MKKVKTNENVGGGDEEGENDNWQIKQAGEWEWMNEHVRIHLIHFIQVFVVAVAAAVVEILQSAVRYAL